MKAYHIRTNEPNRDNPTGLDSFTLNALYIPDMAVVIACGVAQDKKQVEIRNYDAVSKRAQCIVDGNEWSRAWWNGWKFWQLD